MPSVDSLSIDTPARQLPAFDLGVVGVALIFLSMAASAVLAVRGDEEARLGLEGRVRYLVPAGWASAEEEGGVSLRSGNLMERGVELRVQLLARGEDGPEPGALDVAAVRVLEEHRGEEAFRVLGAEDRAAFGGHAAAYTYFAYVADPPGVPRGAVVAPEVLRGFDALVLTARAVWWVQVLGPAELAPELEEELDEVLQNLVLLDPPLPAMEEGASEGAAR